MAPVAHPAAHKVGKVVTYNVYMVKSSRIWNSFFEDKHGNVVIYQRPNILIIVAFASSSVALMTNKGLIHAFAAWVAIIAWLAWSILEVVFGDSHFRKTIGALSLVIEAVVLRYFFLS